MNVSVPVSLLTFTVYGTASLHNLAFAVCIILLFITSLCLNLLVVLVILADPALHRPMFVLLANLVVSGQVGTSCVCLSIIKNLLNESRQASLPGCYTQVFLSSMYTGCIFGILGLMAYDRYVSVCKPLHYHLIMTRSKVTLLLLLLYSFLFSVSAVQIYLTSRADLCGHTINKLLCDIAELSHLFCTENRLLKLYGLCCAICVISLPFVLVAASYVHIFVVIFKTSRESQRRALQTCTPHLVTFINFSVATFFGFIYSRVEVGVPTAVNILTYMNFSVIPSILHPVIYGIKMQEIRLSLAKLITKIKITKLKIIL